MAAAEAAAAAEHSTKAEVVSYVLNYFPMTKVGQRLYVNKHSRMMLQGPGWWSVLLKC